MRSPSRPRRLSPSARVCGQFSLLALATVALAELALVACSSEPNTNFGPPNGLRNVVFPGTGSTSPPPPPPPPPPPASDGGAPSGDSGSAAADCGVSWTNDIYPKMQTTGTWKCATAGTCHSQGVLPAIDPQSATTTYNSLMAYTGINSLPYIAPGVTDPTKSTFECNISPAPATCSIEMPQVSATVGSNAATAAEITEVDTWVKCGAPLN